MRRVASRSLVLLALAAAPLAAQPSFVEVTPPLDPLFVTPPEEDFWINAVAPADVDGDGDLDLAVLGFYVVYNVSATDRLVLLLNQGPDGDGNWQFAHQEVPLGAVSAGASDLAWGDFDGDGDHDLAVGSDGATVVYRNDGGVLVPLANELPGYWEDSSYTGAYDLRSIIWADADNDGDLDLLIPSVFDFDLLEYSTRLLRNDGSDGAGGWTFTDTAAALDPTRHAQSAWADDDRDGDLDLFLANIDPYFDEGFIKRFRNDGGVFVGESLVDLSVQYGLADWGDADGDGDLDVLVCGNLEEPDGTFVTAVRLYRREAAGFTLVPILDAPSADWLDLHAATWADYDSDGDVDLLVTGNHVGDGEIVGKSEIFSNENGNFVPQGITLPAPISSIGRGGAFTWFDLDGDGDLDYLVAGAYYVPGGNGLVEAKLQLLRNATAASNAPPSAPQQLQSQVTGDSVTLTWSPANDDHTPTASLTYELRLARAGAGHATAERLPEPGNLSAASSWTLSGLEPGAVYRWSLLAVDSALDGGAARASTFAVPGGTLIFYDGLESGDASGWSSAAP